MACSPRCTRMATSIPEARKRRAGAESSPLENLADGPLAQVVSLVQDPHRQQLRLVCRKLCSVEAATRTSLVFRVPLTASNRPSSTSSPPRPQERGPICTGDSLHPHPCATNQDSDSESESDVGTSTVSIVNGIPRLPGYIRSFGSPASVVNVHRTDSPGAGVFPLPAEGILDVEERHPRVLLPSVQLEKSESLGAQPSSVDHLNSNNIEELRSRAGNGQSQSSLSGQEFKTCCSKGVVDAEASTGTLHAAQSYASDTESCQQVGRGGLFHGSLSRQWAASDADTSEDESSSLIRRNPHRRPLRKANAYGMGYAKLQSADSPKQNLSTRTGFPPTILHSPSPSQSLFRVPSPAESPMSATPSPRAGSLHQFPLLSPTVSSFLINSSEELPGRSLNWWQRGRREADEILPEDMLSRLLRRFTNIECLDICHLHPGVANPTGTLDRRLLTAVSVLAPNLEELHLSGHSLGWQVDDAGLAAVARGCPRLRKLVVHHWVVGGSGMAALADAGQLQELEMDFFARDQAQGPRRTVSEVARCHSLTSLHLRYCNNGDVAAIAEGCPKLKRLTLLFSVLGPSFTTLGRQCKGLQELTLRSCDTMPPDDPLSWLAEHCTSLTSLSLHAGHCASEQGLLGLVTSCRGLSKLSLEFKPLPLKLPILAPHLAQLTELTLQWVEAEDEDLSAIGRHCKQLRVLVLSLRQKVTDAGITSLLRGCGGTLEVLLLRVRDASEAVLPVLGSCCAALQRLTLGLPRITSDGVSAMFHAEDGERPRLAVLRRLRLWDCTSLNDDSLQHVWEYCPNLEGLGLKGCTNLTTDGLCNLIDQCLKLAHVEVEPRFLCEAVQGRAQSREFDLVKASP